MPTLSELKRKAASLGYTVEDDKDGTALYVHAPDGKGWDGGSLTSLVEVYGSCGSYLPAWRTEAIKELLSRLAFYPPTSLADCEQSEAEHAVKLLQTFSRQ